MKVQIMMSVSGLMEIEVPDEKKDAIEALLDESDGRAIDVEKFEEAAGIAWDWDEMLNTLDFEIDDVDLPGDRVPAEEIDDAKDKDGD